MRHVELGDERLVPEPWRRAERFGCGGLTNSPANVAMWEKMDPEIKCTKRYANILIFWLVRTAVIGGRIGAVAILMSGLNPSNIKSW